MRRNVKYRVEVDYYSRYYEDKCLEESTPIYSEEEGWQKYQEAIEEKCIDNPEKPARVHFWKYGPVDERGWHTQGETIAKNY